MAGVRQAARAAGTADAAAAAAEAAAVLNPTAGSLLAFLEKGDMTGWDLVQLAHTFIGDYWSLTQSQVYRELESLRARGLVAAAAPGPRHRRVFSVTEAGRAAFAEWLGLDAGPDHIRMPLLLKVSFGGRMDPAVLRGHLLRHREIHRERLAGYRTLEPIIMAPGADPYVAATLWCGILHEEAMLRWFESLPAAWWGDGG